MTTERGRSHAVAIVGMGCRFAGAPDLHAYWELTREGRQAFSPVPSDRWPNEAFFDTNRRATDRSYAPAGGFIDDVRSFPALHLGIPPRRVEVMDPQQRLSLEIALQAIEDAGYSPDRMPRKTGVFVGVTANEFRVLVSSRVVATLMATGSLGEAPEDVDALARAIQNVVPSRPFSAPGVLSNMIAAAVAQELDLHGPAYTVDAACASAMIGVANAVQQLRVGAIDAAVAGGSYLQLTPEHYIAFSRIGAISGSGVCRPFDARADGFVQGDGAGMLVLKRLEDAERDGDRVYAVIRGIAINNDGRGDGPMAPVLAGQVEVVRDAWEDAAVDPARLGYLEAHGTGTDVGDQTELMGLRQAFGDRIHDVQLGSSKGNVGHTMSSAGVAGLIRAALAIHHDQIPPLAGFDEAKPELGLDVGAFRVPTAPRSWPTTDRVAGISSFGFGGTNGHAVLTGPDTRPRDHAVRTELVRISAPDADTLRRTAARTAAALRERPDDVASVARAWEVRPSLAHRAAIVASTLDELLAGLDAVAAGKPARGLASGVAGAAPKVALLFPGQGAQRVGMLAALRDRFPVVDEALKTAEEDLADLLPVPLTHLLWPERRQVPVDAAQAEADLTLTSNTQPALVAAGIACWRLLEQLGVQPVVAGGHSLGEFAAAVVGGVLSARDAVRFAALRGRAMAAVEGDRGAMAALMAPVEAVRPLLADGAVVANENHPSQVVVSGATDAVRLTCERAAAAGIDAKPLTVSHAFHSPIFAGIDAQPWIDAIHVADPSGPVVASCIADRPYASRADAIDVFRRHATSPVRFGALLEQCRAQGADLYLQVGAGGPLASFARKGAGAESRGVLTLASNDDADGGRSALETLGWLWVHGASLDTRHVTTALPPASVPPIVLPREPYWPIKDSAQLALKLTRTEQPAPAAAPVAAQPPAEPEPEEVGADEVYDKVAAVVAKVSSYPRASLRPDQVLVDDLGFDSLMVGDLATGLAEAFPGLGGLPQELLLARPTVADIADHVKVARGGAARPSDDEAPLSWYAPVWRPCPLPESSAPAADALKGCDVLVAGDRDAEVTAVLKGLGATVTRRAGKPVDLVIHLGDFDEPTPVSAVLAGEAPVPDAAAPLAKILEEQARVGGRPGVIALCRADDPWAEAVAGVVRAVGREWPDRPAKTLWFEGLDAAFRAARLAQEIVSADTSPDVRWSSAGRAVSGQERIEADRRELGQGDVVLITGGTRGIGAKLAARLVADGARVVVVGRGAPEESVAALPPESAAVVSADVLDRDALIAACAAHGPYTAVVHAAGVLADGAIGEVDADRARLARRIKLEGLFNALAAAPDARVALVTGSWAGRFGNRHQLHYAAANAAVSGFAAHAPERLRVVVAELGPWASSTMVSTIPKAIQAAMRAEGVDFAGDRSGLEALATLLGAGSGPVVLGRRLPWWNRSNAFEEVLSVDSHPFLADHAIEGVPVLPLASATDLLARASGLPLPLEVRDVQLFSGVTVKSPVRLRATIRGDRAELRLLGERDVLCYRATVAPAGEVEIPDATTGGQPTKLDVKAFYGGGLTFHGKLLQGMVSVEAAGEDFVRGKVRAGRVGDWIPETARKGWTVDPLALDSAFQMAALVAWERYERAGTPVALRRIVVLRPWPAGTALKVDARFEPPEPGSDRFAADFVFRDGAGAVVAVAEGAVAELRRVAGDDKLVIKREWVDPSVWPEVRDLDMRLEAATALGIANPYFHVHQGTARNTTTVDGRELVNFSSYNYLGLSGDPRVLAEVEQAIHRYGTSVSASRVASGERPFHHELESELARAQGVDDALVFTAGHMTNVNVVGHLMKPPDLVLHDELIHDSLLQGIKLSGAGRRAFRHDDPEHLDKLLKDLRPNHEKCLILVEGVYSMDGDLCTLPAYVALKRKHGAMLLVDEAHSFGVCGPTGCGIGEHYRDQLDPRDVDLWMGTLSKSLASCGGWIGGGATLIRYLRYTAPGFVYSAGITPANGTAALASLRLMLAEPWRVEKLQQNARLFHDALVQRGVDTGPAKGGSAVVPAITGNSMHALLLSQRLRDQGVNVQPIVYPAVADDAARLRFFLSSTHTAEELVQTAEKVATTLTALRTEFPAI
ncbi:MAG: aminotransferase class I/II-fold pyridoxal phosphate-dependent enzyme [Alphaproteobacteria bacterium]|nr:aminotransferase class I/II-fold pyridoxal phosphate-dependent enzyme [Alphaproteobacteria bacterium]